MTNASAHDVVMAMLSQRFGGRGTRSRAGLMPFQRDACDRLLDILAARRGALLADSVGLGKTHVARAVIEDATRAGERVVVCGPAQLAAHWKRHLRGIDGCLWISHTRASRGGFASVGAPDLVVVDEAHAFRNPRARRYEYMSRLCANARVLLITATPVNNSIMDFYNLVRLFAADDAFVGDGVPDLYGAFRSGDLHATRRVAELVMVRRTREVIEHTRAPTGGALRFPRCAPLKLLHYDLTDAYPDTLATMLEAIGCLAFSAHVVDGVHAAPELMRMTLLKRLESSAAALTTSLERYAAVLMHFVGAAEAGLLFDAARDRALYTRVQDATQLSLEHITLRPWPRGADRAAAIDAARRERHAITNMLVELRHAAMDPKLARLRALLDGELNGRSVLVFTEFRETALHLWNALAPRGGVGLIHGNDARLGRGRASRRAVIERFAPYANGVRPPKEHQRVRLLIATDVLAEGLNLQDAHAVISYDAPWNPVRLAQRIGRIDRLGSPHDEVHAFAFRPERHVDELLGLVRRISTKLRAIRTIGGDAPRIRSRPTNAPTRIRAAPDLDLVERLRVAFRERGRIVGRTGLAACVQWNAARHGAICCVRTGTSAFLVLIDGPAHEIGGARIDRVLLDVLRSDPPPTAAPDPARLAEAGRHALAAVRMRMEAPRRDQDGAGRKATARVRHWLATRPAGALPEDIAVADALLRRIREGDATTLSEPRRRATTAGSSKSEVVAVLVLEPRVDPCAPPD